MGSSVWSQAGTAVGWYLGHRPMIGHGKDRKDPGPFCPTQDLNPGARLENDERFGFRFQIYHLNVWFLGKEIFSGPGITGPGISVTFTPGIDQGEGIKMDDVLRPLPGMTEGKGFLKLPRPPQ